MIIGFLIAAIVSALLFGVHLFVGTGEVHAPLMESGIDQGPRYTLYLVWHMVTVLLGVMAAGFAWAAFVPSAWDVGVVLVVMAGLCTVWGAWLQMSAKLPLAVLPQWTGLAAVCGAGAWSLIFGT